MIMKMQFKKDNEQKTREIKKKYEQSFMHILRKTLVVY